MTNAVQTTEIKPSQIKRRGQFGEILKRFKRSKLAMVGAGVFLIIILMAIFADLIVPYSKALEQNLAQRLLGSSPEHIFGTDELGRDLFARIVHGSRNSISIGLLTTLFSVVLGCVMGSIAAFFGRKVDNLIIFLMEVVMSVPLIILAMMLIAVTGMGLQNLVIALSLGLWPGYARVIRSQILSIKKIDFVEAARAIGLSDRKIIVRHILPNVMGPIIVSAAMSMAGCILAASGLSFIGLGVQPPAPEWGRMVATGQSFLRTAPNALFITGSFILLSALSINLIGDGIRDALDPKMKR
jgi:peptide/nickel transport system permease protein